MPPLLSYEVRGSGPGLVLVHGTGQTGIAAWGALADRLSADYTVVMPDLPGSGDSPLPETPLAVDTIADQVAATADEAGVDSFAVAGSSLGAAVAIRLAAAHPERVRALATLCGFAHAETTLRLNLELWASLYAPGDENVAKFLVALSVSEQFLAALPPNGVQQMITAAAKRTVPGAARQIALALALDVRPDLSAIHVPTLVVAPTDDRFVTPRHTEDLLAGIPTAVRADVPGGHGIILENPDETLRALLDFLKTTPAGAL